MSEAIDAQREFLEAFNRAVEGSGPTFPIPDDRLLSQTDLEQLAAIRDVLLDRLAEQRGFIESLVDEIQALLDQLNDLQSGLEEGDPFLADKIQGVLKELETLQEALEGEGCLGS